MAVEDTDPPQRHFSDATAAYALSGLVAAGPYLPWGAGVMRPAGLVALCNDVVLAGRRSVVELGGGTSTVLLARLLRQRGPSDGARQVVVEHDEQWASWLEAQLDREGLLDAVSVVRAPLAPHPLGRRGLHWYDDDALRSGLDAALTEPIDLLVVDGPPADTSDKVLARYPALPALADRLAPGATVVLDDVEQPGEQEVLRRWEAELGLGLAHCGAAAGIAVGRVPSGGLRQRGASAS